MAKKFDTDLVNAAKAEIKATHGKNGSAKINTEVITPVAEVKTETTAEQPKPSTPDLEQPKTETKTESANVQSASQTIEIPDPVRDEFREQFDACFKEFAGFASGALVVEMVDDLKSNFLFMLAKKNKIDSITDKEIFKMTGNSKKFAAFLVDHAIKNNMLDWLKKYPLLGAAGVIGISGASGYMVIQTLKKKDDETRQKNEEIERLREENERFRTAAGFSDSEKTTETTGE